MMDNESLKTIFFETYHGEEIVNCIQCGSCSASCPLASKMDYGPRQLFALAREGFMQEVLSANTMWFCVSCYGCTVKCPRDISITDHMYALKKMAIKHKLTHSKSKMPMMYKSFSDPVKKFGKITDTSVIFRYAFFYPIDIMKNSRLAFNLAKKSRLDILIHPIKNLIGFKKVINKALELEKE
jgi:heterodisulfide reductase subunit C